MGGRFHYPHLADREQAGVGDAPQRQHRAEQDRIAGRRHAQRHAQRQQPGEDRGGAQRCTVDRLAAQPVADQADRAKAHQPPADVGGRDAGDAFQDVGQVGVGGEHGGEYQDRQRDVGQKEGFAEQARLRAEVHAPGARHGRHQAPQGERNGQRQRGQDPEGAAPADAVGGNRPQRNAEQQGRRNAQIDLGHRLAGLAGPRELGGGLARRAPEYRQRQRWDEARQRQHPDIRGHCRQRIGQREHEQHRNEQRLAVQVRQPGRQRRAEQHDGEGEQGYQLAGHRDGDAEVARQGRQQADDQEFGGDDQETGERQDEDRQGGRCRRRRLGDHSGRSWMGHAIVDGLIRAPWYWKCVFLSRAFIPILSGIKFRNQPCKAVNA